MTAVHSWDVTYPEALIPYVELFRVEYIPYEAYDRALASYLTQVVGSGPLRIVSLGCGTGQHETNLALMGHAVIGIDKDDESLRHAAANALAAGADAQFRRADLLDGTAVREAVDGRGAFDVALMLGVQLSMADHANAARRIHPMLKTGGAFVTGLWGYLDDFDRERLIQESCVEIAGDRTSPRFAVRLNTYTYLSQDGHYFIDWDAVYLYPGPGQVAMMHRRSTDRIEMAPEIGGNDPLSLSDGGYCLMPSQTLHQFRDMMCLPHTYEYLVAWKRL